MKELKYSDIIAKNRILGSAGIAPDFSIAIFANVVVDQCVEIIEYGLRSQGVNAVVYLGNYNNIVQDVTAATGFKAVVIFWELANLLEGLFYKITTHKSQIIEEQVKTEILLLLEGIRETPLVVLNRFSSLPLANPIVDDIYGVLCHRLNTFLEEKTKDLPNVKLLNLDVIYARASLRESIDWRYFFSSKAPYTVSFFKEYAAGVMPLFLAVAGKTKKALILDCDNTLWKGVLGEDGVNGIKMSANDGPGGAAFEAIQHYAVQLSERGVIVGLCSKNNPEDVDDVLANHPDMILRDKHLAIKLVNWDDKVSNLREISRILNIGLDSIVFIDDSDFEINLVRQQLPSVTALQVPKRLYEYPSLLLESGNLFYSLSQTVEDGKKTEMYKIQAEREKERSNFQNIEEYLVSLMLEVSIIRDEPATVPRISQLTQKTNQFNLTTRRYTEKEIEHFLRTSSYHLIAFDVRDKFGEYGIVGLFLIKLTENVAHIENFLMSCRVIGRSIEYAVFDYLIDLLKGLGVKNLTAEFIKSGKNQQVQHFYEQLGFDVVEKSDMMALYRLPLQKFNYKNINYIKVTRNEGN